MNEPLGEDLAAVIKLVSDRSGFELTPTRMVSIEAGLRRTMTQAKKASLIDYVDYLRADPAALDDLIDEVMIRETYFFRDAHHFSLAREHWFPERRAQRGSGIPLKVWCAGCAGGEEPYSLAMAFDLPGLDDALEIAGTDISRAALAQARKGVYGSWSLRGLDAKVVDRYFQREGKSEGFEQFSLAPRIRGRVAFSRENIRESRATGLDLIFCRNVLIYFSRETVREVAQLMFTALDEGGWLVTGPSDPLLVEYAPFELYDLGGALVHKRPKHPGVAAALFKSSATPIPGPVTAMGERPLPPPPRKPVDDKPVLVALAIREVKALADQGKLEEALALAEDALERFPVSEELLFLSSIVLTGLGRHVEAAQAARRLVFLDSTLAMAHYTLATALWAVGDRHGATHAYQQAIKACGLHAPDAAARFSDDLTYGQLSRAAQARLEGQR